MNEFRGLFLGLTTLDIQYFVDDFPGPNTKVKTPAPEILVGGPATNAAVAFSFLNKGAFLASAVGNNSFSKFAEEDFRYTGIEHADLIRNQRKNVVIASVITSSKNGDRNIFTHHPEKISPEITPEKLFKIVQPDILELDGFYPEFSLECAQVANAQNIPVILDCGSWKPQYSDLLSCDVIPVCSSDFFPPGCSKSDEIFEYFTSSGIQKAAISRGGNNLVYQHEKRRGEVKIAETPVADTLGAGDFLHGAFCYYYLKCNFNFPEALKYATRLASFTCQFKGTREWLNFTI